ncbi:MAG: hypothetical protein KDA51_01325 [Planctomycetales bacterium]|nr:hypothetical protein [Planctomycetales bacterium]
MRLACRYALPLAVVAAVSLVAQAHPGHAQQVVPAQSAWHYWLQPEHAMISWVLLALPIVFVLVASRRLIAMRRSQRLTPVPVARRHVG